MKDLFIERLQSSMKQNMKILVKVLGHSGVFALIPFMMLAVYVLIMTLQDGNLHSFYQSFILTGLFLFFTLNKGIVSFISDFDEVYLAPKIKEVEGYFIYCLLYNLTIQSIKVTLFSLFLLYVFSLNTSELIPLFLFFTTYRYSAYSVSRYDHKYEYKKNSAIRWASQCLYGKLLSIITRSTQHLWNFHCIRYYTYWFTLY